MPTTKSRLKSSSKDRSIPHAWLYVHPNPLITRMAAEETVAADLNIDPEIVHHHQNVVWLQVEPDKLSMKRNDIQSILNELSLTVSNSELRRWVIIESAHQLTPEAANALLKVIEEPPPQTHIILTTTGATRVMSTLRSRTALKSFASLDDDSQTNPEQLDLANQFIDGSVSHRLAIIAVQHKAGRLADWLDELNQALRIRRNWADLEWLQQNQVSQGSNRRLLAEALAVRGWLE